MEDRIPVIDLFAGPGGLGEGFDSFTSEKKWRPFKVSLSIEKDIYACRTLELRSFFRQFEKDGVPKSYYKYLQGRKSKEDLFRTYKREAKRAQRQAWHATLGETPKDEVDDRIDEAIDHSDVWLLIGGPPCQAYSIAGRSRIRGEDKKNNTNNYENDHRHHLYREYLRILAVHQPPLFLMENVKGILSSEVKGEKIFGRICSDLKSPVNAIDNRTFPKYLRKCDVEYRIYPLIPPAKDETLGDGSQFVIKSEEFGIPQARHRVFLLGVRSDLEIEPGFLSRKKKRTVHDAIFDLPPIRSRLSKEPDSLNAWQEELSTILKEPWLEEINNEIRREIVESLKYLPNLLPSEEFIRAKYYKKRIRMEKTWFFDVSLKGFCNHVSRSHISKDLKRYFYAACFARVKGRSPVIADFPMELYPHHRNLQAQLEGEIIFDDRFHVQLLKGPATTIVSHMAKDGHYFIHPDPLQCRSLTVREAARLQTFPDNYFFEGSRTAQYKQVGNAVPPLLAKQIAQIVYAIFQNESEILQPVIF